MSFERHPLSAAWPDMPEDDLLALAADIKKRGLLDSIVLLDGMVLDGWHRQQACQAAEVTPRFRKYDASSEGDPREYVESKNAHRRHVTASQKAAAIVKTWEWVPPPPKKGRGGETISPPSEKALTNGEMARRAGVSTRIIQQAKVAERAGLGDAVRDGKITASAAAKQAQPAPAAPKLSVEEKLRADLGTARAELAEANDLIRDLQTELKSYETASLETKAQQVEVKKLHVYIRTLESQRDEHMNRAAQWQRECKGLKKRLGEK